MLHIEIKKNKNLLPNRVIRLMSHTIVTDLFHLHFLSDKNDIGRYLSDINMRSSDGCMIFRGYGLGMSELGKIFKN